MLPRIWSVTENFVILDPLGGGGGGGGGGGKKAPGDVIILHMCTINDNMINGSWDMECDR